jgi:hypothetical protein
MRGVGCGGCVHINRAASPFFVIGGGLCGSVVLLWIDFFDFLANIYRKIRVVINCQNRKSPFSQ